mmetsp:Transcript_22092/g.34745  ORF Transcript_22092/g.34745 Transcript_22092/m.34745 type:complete len:89 (+) Transcript_22092:573-839(+)
MLPRRRLSRRRAEAHDESRHDHQQGRDGEERGRRRFGRFREEEYGVTVMMMMMMVMMVEERERRKGAGGGGCLFGWERESSVIAELRM